MSSAAEGSGPFAALGRLGRRALRWLRAGADRLVYPKRVNLTAGGAAVRFDVFSRVEEHRVVSRGREDAYLERLIGAVREDDVVFDVGASVGLMTVTAAAVARSGRVFAFEPDPETRRRLEHNVGLNDLENVEVLGWALTDRRGRAELFTDGASGFAPTLRRQEREGAPRGRVEVPTVRLDGAIEEGDLPVPSLVKVDVEGAEGLCLAGAEALLRGVHGPPPRRVFLELHPEFLPSFGDSVEKVEARLRDAGYRELWRAEREGQVHADWARADEPGDGEAAGGEGG